MKTTPPLVTVLMPAYNVEAYIAESIKSIQEQTYPNWELIIVEDCSTDGTLKAIEPFLTDTRIRLIRNTKNLKLVGTLNRGIAEAKGEFIARLDSDDVAYPERLAEQVAAIENDSQAGLVATWTANINERGEITGYGNWEFSPEAMYFSTFFHNCVTHSSVMFRTKLVRELGGYHQIIAEDFELWGRISQQARLLQIRRPLVKYRVHSASLMSQYGDLNPQSATSIVQERLLGLTGISLPPETIGGMITWGRLRDLSPEHLKIIAETFPRIVATILEQAPSFYDKTALRRYAGVELVKYRYFLRKLGHTMKYPSGVTISPSDRLLGYLYYRQHFTPTTLLDRVMPKTHY